MIGCQLFGTGGFFIYAFIVDTKTEMAEDAARAVRHAAEAKEYDEALRKLLDGMNADTPLAEFFQHTRRTTDASRDQVVAAAIAKKSNLEAELIAALHGAANARRGSSPLSAMRFCSTPGISLRRLRTIRRTPRSMALS